MVFDRELASESQMAECVTELDALMSTGQIIKDSNTCSVSRIRFNGRDIVIKRYNNKGWFHTLRNTIKGSRAKKSWLFGHRLPLMAISTPKPLAYIEYRRGPLVWKSYMITDHVNAKPFSAIVRDTTIDADCLTKATEQVRHMLDTMGRYNITHGDLKHANILISENGPVITDLDAMTRWPWRWLYNIRKSKDMERFTRDLPENAD